MTSAGEISISLRAIGAAGVAAALAKVAKEAIGLASAANETTNVMEQAFGRKGVAEMEAWARTTATALGRSTQWMRETVGTLQSMLEPMTGSAAAAKVMSKGFTQLAVDLGSFWNVADSDALTALKSGISGELEPLKKFGIVMTEAALNAYALDKGIHTTVQKMSEAQKATLRYNFILDRTTKAHGDAQRTADGYANTMKSLEADIQKSSMALGQQMLPAWQDLVVTFQNMLSVMSTSDWSDFFRDVGAGVKTVAGMFLGLAEAVLTALGALKMMSASSAGSMLGLKIDAGTEGLESMVGDIMRMRAVLNGEVSPSSTPAKANNLQRLDFKAASAAGGKGAKTVDINWGASESESQVLMDEDTKKRNRDYNAELREFTEANRADLQKNANLQALAADLEFKAIVQRNEQTERTIKANELAATAFEAARRAEQDMRKAERDAFSQGSIVGVAQGLAGGDLKGVAEKSAMLGAQGAMSAIGMGANQIKTSMASLGTAAAAVGPMLETLGATVAEVVSLIKGVISGTVGRFGEAAFGGNRALGALGGGAQKAAPLLMAGAGAAGLASPLLAAGAVAAPGVAATGGAVAAAGAGAVVLGSALFELSLQTKSYTRWQKNLEKATQPLVNAMEPLWHRMMPLTATMGTLSAVAGVFLQSLIPGPAVFQALFWATKHTALGIMTVAIELGHIINAVARKQVINTQEIAGYKHALEPMTFAALLAADNLEALADAAESSMNVPEVSKLSYRRYLAMRDENGQMSGDAAGGIRTDPTSGQAAAGGITLYGDLVMQVRSLAEVDELQQKVRDGEYRRAGNVMAGRSTRMQGI